MSCAIRSDESVEFRELQLKHSAQGAKASVQSAEVGRPNGARSVHRDAGTSDEKSRLRGLGAANVDDIIARDILGFEAHSGKRAGELRKHARHRSLPSAQSSVRSVSLARLSAEGATPLQVCMLCRRRARALHVLRLISQGTSGFALAGLRCRDQCHRIVALRKCATSSCLRSI